SRVPGEHGAGVAPAHRGAGPHDRHESLRVDVLSARGPSCVTRDPRARHAEPLPRLRLLRSAQGHPRGARRARLLVLALRRRGVGRRLHRRVRDRTMRHPASTSRPAIEIMAAAYLAIGVGVAAAVLTLTTTILYICVYTPLKLRTASCMLVGAVPGALPPVAGWVAARGDLGLGAVVLFGILFLWQLPHTLAIAYLYADDYARAGVRVLPVVDPNGAMSERQIVSSALGLVAVSLLPTVIGVSGIAYFVTACALGLGLLGAGLAHANTPSTASARRVLMASLLYLPLLLAVLAFDKT